MYAIKPWQWSLLADGLHLIFLKTPHIMAIETVLSTLNGRIMVRFITGHFYDDVIFPCLPTRLLQDFVRSLLLLYKPHWHA